MHPAAREFVARALAEIPPPEIVMELGSRDVNGGIRDLLGDAYYIGVDRMPGDGVTVLADAAEYRPAALVDLVVCAEMLEHAENASGVIANAHRVLLPGGYLIATMAGEGRAPHSAVDGAGLRLGEFYRNVSEADLRDWLRLAGFDDQHDATFVYAPARGDLYVKIQKSEVPDGKS